MRSSVRISKVSDMEFEFALKRKSCGDAAKLTCLCPLFRLDDLLIRPPGQSGYRLGTTPQPSGIIVAGVLIAL